MSVTSNDISNSILQSINTALQDNSLTIEDRGSLLNQYEQITDMIRDGYQFSEPDLLDLPTTIRNETKTLIDAQIQIMQDWKNGFEDKMYKTYDIYKELEKVTIHTQAQVEADNTLSNEAVFTMQGFQDAKVLNFMFVVNVEGDDNSTQTTSIDLFRYSIGSSDRWAHKLFSSEVEGRNWHDNYRDVNIISVNKFIAFGNGVFKIINTGDKYLEIYAIGIKLQK